MVPVASLVKKFSDIPGPKPFPLLGCLPYYLPYIGEYSFKRLNRSSMKKYLKYGDIVREEIVPGVHLLHLYNPLDIEALFRSEGRFPTRRSHLLLEKVRLDSPDEHLTGGLLCTNGPQWASMRGKFQQSLSKENIAKYIPLTDSICLELVERIGDKNEEKNVKNNFMNFFTGVNAELAAKVFVDEKLGALGPTSESGINNKNSKSACLSTAGKTVNEMVIKTDAMNFWKLFKTKAYLNTQKCINILEDQGRKAIEKRRKDLNYKGSSMIDTWMKDGDKDERELLTCIGDMFLAGIETTTYTSSFILYHLSTNLECQNKLFQELKTHIPKWDSPIDVKILGELSYLKRVLKESLRLNPISIGVGRTTQEDSIIGGYEVPKNTVVVTENQTIGRLEKYFYEPDRFIPDRWTIENRNSRPSPYALLPFGFGPRACIGRRLAEQNMLIVIARLIRRYQFEWNSNNPLDCQVGLINSPDAPLRFNIRTRNE